MSHIFVLLEMNANNEVRILSTCHDQGHLMDWFYKTWCVENKIDVSKIQEKVDQGPHIRMHGEDSTKVYHCAPAQYLPETNTARALAGLLE